MNAHSSGLIDLKDAVRLLQEKREELLRLLDAVDEALEALHRVDVPPAAVPEPAVESAAALPTRLAPARTLTDEHKHAMKEGRRKARHAKEVAAGLAREPLPDAFGPATDVAPPPRLVKRPK